MSSAYHLQSNSVSERTNKTVIQCIRFAVERNQCSWVEALPMVRFDIMNTMNSSTGFSPFRLRFGESPRLLPPFATPSQPDHGKPDAQAIINTMPCVPLNWTRATTYLPPRCPRRTTPTTIAHRPRRSSPANTYTYRPPTAATNIRTSQTCTRHYLCLALTVPTP